MITCVANSLLWLGSILDKVSEDKDTSYSCILMLCYKQFKPFLLMLPVSEASKDTEDTEVS